MASDQIDEDRSIEAAWAAARAYEQAPNGEGLDGAVSRMEIAIKAALAGASEEDALAEALKPFGYGVHARPLRWIREADLAARVEAERVALSDAATDPAGEYHTGLYCGVEDRGITDRYEAALYGWQQAFEYMQSALGPTPAFDAAIKAARREGMEEAEKIAQADERTYQGYVGCNPALIVPRIIAAIRAAKDHPA